MVPTRVEAMQQNSHILTAINHSLKLAIIYRYAATVDLEIFVLTNFRMINFHA